MHLGSSGKEFNCNTRDRGDLDSIPGLGRSPGGGNGNPHQYSCLENPMDWGSWWATVCGVVKSQTRLNMHTRLISSDQLCSSIICLLPVPSIDSLLLGSVRFHCALDLEPYSPHMCISLSRSPSSLLLRGFPWSTYPKYHSFHPCHLQPLFFL